MDMKLTNSPVVMRVKDGCADKLRQIVQGNNPSVFVVQGLPASGKTTFLNNVKGFLDGEGIASSVIHSDNYIEDFSDILANERRYRIGVVDIFRKNGMFLNSKTKKDESHGNMVVSVLRELIPKSDISLFEIKISDKDGKYKWDARSVLKQLKKISALPDDKKFDYLNLSMLFNAEYDTLSPEQLHYPEIVEQIRANMTKTVLHIIEEIEKIVQRGTEVFISAGNRASTFNLLSLAQGTRTIGGSDKDNEPITYFTQNSLIEDYAKLPYNLSNGVLDLSKMSKAALRKRIATKQDYETLKEVVSKIKNKIDFDYLQFSLIWQIPQSLRSKIYDVQTLMEILGADVSDELTPDGTHCDISMRQFFDMNAKGERHVISTKKTHRVKNTVSGTSFAVPQAIAEDIKLREIARKFVESDYEFYAKILSYM